MEPKFKTEIKNREIFTDNLEMFRLVSDWFLFVVLILQLFYGMGDAKFLNTEVEARWVFCPVLFVTGIIWKHRLDIHERIFRKPSNRIEYV